MHTWSDKAFNGTNVNPALPALHGGSLENTLAVPFIEKNYLNLLNTSVTMLRYVFERVMSL